MPKTQRTFGEYSETQGVAESVLCIPQSSYKEAIDAFMQPSFLFQATVSPKHPIQGAGLVAASKVCGACVILSCLSGFSQVYVPHVPESLAC